MEKTVFVGTFVWVCGCALKRNKYSNTKENATFQG